MGLFFSPNYFCYITIEFKIYIMMGRKTVSREVIVEKMNELAKSNSLTKNEKLLILTFGTSILLRGNSYKGYTYNGTSDEPQCREYN